jgi:hypothetical protein
VAKPFVRRALRTAIERQLDEARIATMKAAKQVYGIGEIPAGMRSRGLEKCDEMRMTRCPFARDARELGFGNADRRAADGPIDRHPFPLVPMSQGKKP